MDTLKQRKKQFTLYGFEKLPNYFVGKYLNIQWRNPVFRLFSLNDVGQLSIIAEPNVLTRDQYPVLIAAIDDGEPVPRETTRLIEINFPRINPTGVPVTLSSTGDPNDRTTEAIVAAATFLPEDNMLTIILGAVAGMLLVIITILVVYIIWR